jgi:hypothetical protein
MCGVLDPRLGGIRLVVEAQLQLWGGFAQNLSHQNRLHKQIPLDVNRQLSATLQILCLSICSLHPCVFNVS